MHGIVGQGVRFLFKGGGREGSIERLRLLSALWTECKFQENTNSSSVNWFPRNGGFELLGAKSNGERSE